MYIPPAFICTSARSRNVYVGVGPPDLWIDPDKVVIDLGIISRSSAHGSIEVDRPYTMLG
jgi:hypothetical protein